MPLAPETRLGPYEITAPLGAGGMGEVYRARDVRLGREVAIKVLPGDVAADPERRARFEREARAVAALDHPHICGIYDVGEANASDESGEWQVWVQPFPTTGERRQVSSSGGSEPRWRGDGRELFYLAPDGTIMSVAVEGADGFRAAAPRPLFSVEVPLFGSPYRNMYTTTRDGQRFLVNTRVERTPPSINVILNASSLLRGTAKP